MTVQELIAKLQALPQDAEVGLVWDGANLSDVRNVWLARGGVVLLSDAGEVVYYDTDRPQDAPLAKDDPYWQTPKE